MRTRCTLGPAAAKPWAAAPPMMATDLQLDLERDRTASATARRAVRERLADDLPRDRLEDVLLITTELINNAVVHGEGLVRLRLQFDGHVVRGEVVDDGGGFERDVRARGTDEIGGRGLHIVDQLTSDWGIHEGTTHVWFELHTHVWFELSGDATGAPDRAPEPRLGADERPSELG